MPPQFSFELPTHRVECGAEFISAEAITDLSSEAEALGFGACHVTDHPAPDAKWLQVGGHHALDPFVALAAAAGATSNLRLLTNMYIAAYRNPFLGAKSAFSLDALSSGRLILGTAAGYLKPEFAALGVDFSERGALLDEALDVLYAVWSGEVTEYQGRHFGARGVQFQPTPPSAPTVWIGGNSTAAIRRAVSRAQGWAPFATSGYAQASRTAPIDSDEELVTRIALAHQMADDFGRTEPFDICYSAGSLSNVERSLEERRDHLGRLIQAGVTWHPVVIDGSNRSEVLEEMARFADEMIVPNL
jgi:probable F420-dependent oxidoreductase